MSYASGGLIQATDYNTLSTNLQTVWGTGTGNKGWGQSTSAISSVTNVDNVTATQWSNLIGKTNAALAHQGLSLITPSSVTVGDIITYYAAISTGITNITNAASGTTGIALTDSTSNNATYTGTWGSTGNRGIKFTHTVTFASGDAARYFFNAGGRLALGFSRTGGAATTRNSEWSQLATRCGQWRFSALSMRQEGGSGSPTIPGSTGYWNTGTTATQQITLYDGYEAYSTNYITTHAKLSGTVQNGGYPVITLETYWINTWSNTYQETVDGTATTSLIIQSPSTTYLTNTWGTPTVGTAAVIY